MPPGEVEVWLDEHRETSWGRRETAISIDPTYTEIAAARDFVEKQAISAGMTASDVWDVRVAITEALANAIEHGALSADGQIHVRIAEGRDELRFEVLGGGRAGERQQPNGGSDRGRGMAIMTGTMDSVQLVHDRDRNLIRLAKRLRSSAQA
jgi:anti-sigma regulatory factor (Ser/Thr protein kinase)